MEEHIKLRQKLARFDTATLQYYIVLMLLVFLPAFLDQYQVVLGSVVNFILIYSAVKFSKKKMLPLLFIPSLVTLLKGMLFGPFTVFLVYFLPVIWLGNFLLYYFFAKLHKANLIKALGFGVIAKSVLMIVLAVILVNLFKLPQLLISVMGFMQLLTAGIAGVAYLFVKKVLLPKLQQGKIY